MLVLLLVPLATACGRAGFDPAAVDAATADTPPPAPPVLSCDAPPRFAVDPAAIKLAATATLHGYDVFTVDGAGQVQGFSYAFDTNDLATAKLGPQAGNVPVGTNATGSLAAIAFGDDVLVAMPYGRPDSTGTALIPLDAQMGARGAQVMYDGAVGGVAALARNNNGTLMFATQPSFNEVDLQEVSALGAKLTSGLAVKVTDAPSQLLEPAVMAVGSNFLAVWTTQSGAVHGQLFDDRLAPQTPSAVGVEQSGIEALRAAYAPAADRYLFAWHQKVTGGDEVWITLRDHNLNELVTTRVAAQGLDPVIAAGDNDFLVVWQDTDQKFHLSATRVAMDGGVTPVGVPNAGGTVAGWDMVVHNGQPAVAWVETGGTGPNLWFDPLCH